MLFREGAGWARALYPESRSGLNFLLDDGWDVGYGLDPKRDGDQFGSLILHPERFPSFPGTPPERLRALARAVKDLGWAGLGLWVSPQMAGEKWGASPSPSVLYDDLWRKIGWCGEAGVAYLKVDWGLHCGDVAYRRKISEYARELAPGMLVEHCICGIPLNGVQVSTVNGERSVAPGCGRCEGDPGFMERVFPQAEEILKFCDVFRIYDLIGQLSVAQAVERAQAFMRLAEKAGGGAYVNVEDDAYLAAALGATMGVMRAPNWPAKGNDIRRLRERTGEVARAVAWQRLAPPFRARADYPTRRSEATLTDSWTFRPGDTWFPGVEGQTIPQSAPAVTTRGLDEFPEVADAGEGVPFLAAMRHPNGALAVASLARVDPERGYRVPAVHVRLGADASGIPVGVFGRFRSLTLPASRRPAAVLARDLAGTDEHDVVAACHVEPLADAFAITIPGDVLEKIGSEAIDDQSSPGAVVRL